MTFDISINHTTGTDGTKKARRRASREKIRGSIDDILREIIKSLKWVGRQQIGHTIELNINIFELNSGKTLQFNISGNI